jgi:hypothetical protein
VDAAGPRGEEVPVHVRLHAVGRAFARSGPGHRLGEAARRAGAPVRAQGEGEPDRLGGVGVRDVECALVRRERDAVRRPDRIRDQRHDTVRRHPVHALERDLARGVVVAQRQAEGRVGEVDLAVRRDGEIVRAVEAPARVALGHGREAPVALAPRHAPLAVLAEDEPALAVEGEAVRAGLAPREREIARVAAPGEDERHSRAARPAVDGVARNVGEEEGAARCVPERALRPAEPVGDPLDARARREEGVEAGVEALDARRRRRFRPGARAAEEGGDREQARGERSGRAHGDLAGTSASRMHGVPRPSRRPAR